MDRLILVRHGETAYNARGLMNPDSELEASLSADGEAAARRLGRALGHEPIDAIVTSPRLRARRTAELLAGRRDVEVRDLDHLAEIRADPAAVIVAVTHNLPMRMLVNAAGGADPLTGPLRRVPHATRSDLTAAELDAAIEGLAAWASAPGRPAGGARCARG